MAKSTGVVTPGSHPIDSCWIASGDDTGTPGTYNPPSAADIPVEVASKVDPVMAPLAAAYTRTVYRTAVIAPDELITAATTSFVQTEQRLAASHSRAEKLRAGFRIQTLLPRWWRLRN